MHETELLSTMDVTLSFDTTVGDGYLATFLRRVASHDLPYARFVRCDTTATNLDSLLEHVTFSSNPWWGWAALLDLDAETSCLAIVALRSGVVTAQVAADTVEALDNGERWIRRRIPVAARRAHELIAR